MRRRWSQLDGAQAVRAARDRLPLLGGRRAPVGTPPGGEKRRCSHGRALGEAVAHASVSVITLKPYGEGKLSSGGAAGGGRGEGNPRDSTSSDRQEPHGIESVRRPVRVGERTFS